MLAYLYDHCMQAEFPAEYEILCSTIVCFAKLGEEIDIRASRPMIERRLLCDLGTAVVQQSNTALANTDTFTASGLCM